MPRRDGLPTNQEMLVDFNTTANEVFATAYEARFSKRLPPALEEKPLKYLYFQVLKTHISTEQDDPEGMKVESLYISPLSEYEADGLRAHLTKRHFLEAVLARYESLAMGIGSITLQKGLDIRAVLPPEATVAGYKAKFGPEMHSHSVRTHAEKPSKQSIAMGMRFAEEALAFVRSRERGTLRAIRSAEPSNTSLRAGFSLQLRTDLPLNGHEPVGFLRQYTNVMQHTAAKRFGQLARMREVNAPDIITDEQERLLEEAFQAAYRAQQLLNKKT